jgi:release factor glutamine methyltransferase
VTRGALLADAAARLQVAGVDDPAREARLLMRWASGLGAASLSASIGDAPDAAEADRFAEAVARRAARVPLSHITGRRAFWQHDFIVTPAVLDPRPETEVLVVWALEGPPARRVIDLGTGSGCILLSLLAAWPAATGLGIDASPAALAVAEANAAAMGLSARAAFRRGDWLEGVAETADLVVANPPYLATDELADLAPEVLAEPRAALDGGPDGLDPYRRIARGLNTALSRDGRALLEIGPTQASAVAAIFAAAGFGRHALRRDLDGRPRTLLVARD